MAHYRRKRSHRGSDGGSAWISYSDMMAALLLVFVLILCYSLYQYFSMLETKTAELDEQAGLLAAQQITLDRQQETLDDQKLQLDTQQTLLLAQNLVLSAQTLELEKSQTLLDEQSLLLIQKQDDLDAAEKTLDEREKELIIAKQDLADKQLELDNAIILLGEQQTALDNQALKLESLVGIRTKIIKDLTLALSEANLKASVDPKTGDIILESTVFFDVGKDTIKDEGKAFLQKFIPVYLGVLLRSDYSDFVAEIIIEGHTDTSGSYLANLKLSQERALSVAQFCLETEGLTEEKSALLRSILTAKGRSYSDPIYNADGTVNMDASRRVEFKFRLKDSEMIDEMRKILSED